MAIVDRVSVASIDLQEAFRPQAAITDAYVRPATPPKSPLWDLAEGLSSLSSSLKGFMGKRDAQAAEQDALKGEAAFYKHNSVGYAEAVRQGKIPSFASPEFTQGYKKAQGAALGKRIGSKWELEYSTWAGRNSQDPADFDKFLADFLQRELATDDPDILAGAMPYIRNTTERGYSVNTQERADSLYGDSIEAHVASSSQDIDIAADAGTANGQGTDYDTLFTALIDNREAALATGIREDDYDKQLIDLIVTKSAEDGDQQILELLNRKIPGKDYTFAETPYGRTQFMAGADRITRAQVAKEERQHTLETRADAALKDQMEAFVVEKLAEDPNYVFDEAFLTEYAKLDPQARINVVDWSKKLAGGDEDQEDVLSLYNRIFSGDDPKAVIRYGLDSGVIKKPETIKGLQSFAGNPTDTGRWRNNSVYKSSLGALKTAATPEDERNFWNPDAGSSAAVAIQLDYEKAMDAFMAANPDATDIQISEEAARVFGILDKGINRADPSNPSYATPLAAGLDTNNPLAPNEQQLIDQQAAAEAEANSPAGVMDIWAAEAPPAPDQLPPDERQSIEEIASQMGIDPQVLIERTWQHVQDQIATETANEAIGAGIDAILDAAPQLQEGQAPHPNLTGNPQGETPAESVDPQVRQVAPILDLLGQAEGTDRGDSYNETLGYGAYTGGDVELTSMTLAEVRQLQREMLKHPDNTWNSSAVGRYQIVGTTLKRLMRKMGLSGDEVFTPELQDRMALQLLEDRGLYAYLSGDITRKTFINRLSKEWASLPNSRGVGSYSGQGTGIDLDTLLAVIQQLRAAQITA